MRCVVYTAGDASNPRDRIDRDAVAIWDRQVQADIDKCHRPGAIGVVQCGASWNDYEPVAMVDVPGAVFRDDRLCWGGNAVTAREALATSAPDVTLTWLVGRGAPWRK